MPDPTYAQIGYRSKARSALINTIFQTLTGVNDTDLNLPWAANPNGRWTWTGASAQLAAVKTAGDALTSLLDMSSESTKGQLSLISGTPTVSVATMVPQLVAQTYVKPNQTQILFDETGANWLFKSVRKGTGKRSDLTGNLAALYSLTSVVYSDSDYRDVSYADTVNGHDIVALAGIAKGMAADGIRGGTVNSPARIYAGYLEAEALGSKGQAIALEAQAVNSSLTTALPLGSGTLGYQRSHIGVQAVSSLDLSRGAKSGSSKWNATAFYVTTADPTDLDYAWLRGLEFNAKSIASAGIAIDMKRLTSAQVGMRLHYAGFLTAESSTPGTDINVMRSADILEFFNSTGVYFKDDAGTEFFHIDSAGQLDWRSTQTVAVGSTTLITLGKTGGSGPGTVAQAGWVKMKTGGVQIWLPYWVA